MNATETEQTLSATYPPPVDRLLTYGEGRGPWPDYLALGLTSEHVPDLIRMATDEELNWSESEGPEVWAPIHAWRSLGQLRAEEAIEPLLELIEELEDSDWMREELPEVFGMIGAAAIPALARYLDDRANGAWPRITAGHCLQQIGSTDPAARDECVAVLTRAVERFKENDFDLNGFLISYLVELKAVESIQTIRKAFAAKRVDHTIQGDTEDVEIRLGLRRERSAPADYISLSDAMQYRMSKDKASLLQQWKRKVGRNEACPCGSGRKFKKCCLNAEAWGSTS